MGNGYHSYDLHDTDHEKKERKRQRFRFKISLLLVYVGIVPLFVRLGFMQLIQRDYYSAQVNRNRLDVFSTSAPRGTIYDNRMRVLAYDEPSFSLLYTRINEGERDADVAKHLAPVLQEPRSSLWKQLSGGNERPAHTLFATHISSRTWSFVREHAYELPGVSVISDSVRSYPWGDTAAHVLGYINSIPQKWENEYTAAGFPLSTKVGWSGVERIYDHALRGQPGKVFAEVGNHGIPLRYISKVRAAVRGQDVVLTLDASYQQFVQNLINRQIHYLQTHGHPDVKHAMAVALDPRDGSVLAMASAPSFHPQWFVKGMTYSMYTHSFAPAERNWVTQVAVAPGSVLKPLTALFALSKGVIHANDMIHCDGFLRLPASDGTVIRCWTRHENVSLDKALAQSCDVYFYQLSLRYGHWPPPLNESVTHWLGVSRLKVLDQLEAVQRAFGLGRLNGIDLPGEEAGYISKAGGQVTDLPYTAIGQNEVFTPLELAVYAATVGNGGIRITPHVVSRVGNKRTKFHNVPFAALAKLGIRKEDIEVVQRGMYLACNDSSGTSYTTFHSGLGTAYTVAGKTGTAETGVQGFDNAVFIGYAPYRHPRIALAVIVPGGGHGADSTGPIARGMLDRFFAGTSRKTPVLR